MINQYWGQTNYIPGGTYLRVGSLINVKEGYDTGGTIEYVDQGNFEISQLTNKGAFNEQLSIEASSRINSLQYNTLLFPRSLKKHYSFYDEFNDPASLNSNWIPSDNQWGITNSTLVLTIANSDERHLALATRNDLANFRLIMKMKMGATNLNFGVLFRATNIEVGNLSGYSFQYFNTNNTYRLRSITNNTFTDIISSSTVSPPPLNTYQWYMIVVNYGRAMFYTSTTGLNYTQHIDFSGLNLRSQPYDNCSVGFRLSTSVLSSLTIDNFEIVEIGNRYTNEEILKKIAFMGGVDNIHVPSEMDSVLDKHGFQMSNGSSFTVGVTNGYELITQTSVVSGNSWHTFLGTSNLYGDVTFEGEMKGTSGSILGVFVGTTATFYGNYHEVGDNTLNNSVEYYNNSRITYRDRGDYFNMLPDRWYKFKLIKQGRFISWYVNDMLVNSILGSSFADTNSVGLGVLSYRGSGVSGKVSSWRKLRVSSMYDTMDDVTVDVNNSLDSEFKRFTPEGTVVNQAGNTTELIQLGQSRGLHSIDNYIANSEETNSYTTNSRFIYSKGPIVIRNTGRDTSNLNHYKMTFINDQSIQTPNHADRIGSAHLAQENRDIHSINIKLNANPTIQIYDDVSLVDPTLGISWVYSETSYYSVGNVHKTYNTQGVFETEVNLFLKQNAI